MKLKLLDHRDVLGAGHEGNGETQKEETMCVKSSNATAPLKRQRYCNPQT